MSKILAANNSDGDILYLPDVLAEATLDDIAFWGSGGTPSRRQPNYFYGAIPWLKTGELGDKYVYDSEEKISHFHDLYCRVNSSLLTENDHYQRLRELMDRFSKFKSGKAKLSDLRSRSTDQINLEDIEKTVGNNRVVKEE